jgi:hypothetical protein
VWVKRKRRANRRYNIVCIYVRVRVFVCVCGGGREKREIKRVRKKENKIKSD